MAIRTLPTAPRRTDDPDTFIANTDAWMTAIPGWTDDVNATAANLNTVAAGGAYAIAFKWGVTVNGSIGYAAGGCLVSSAGDANTQPIITSATNLFLDAKDISGVAIQSLLNSMVAGNGSTIKGHIRLVKLGDQTKWARFSVSAYNNNSSLYGNFTVTPIDASGATPFTTGDTVLLFFQRTGDIGPTGTILRRSAAVTTASSLAPNILTTDISIVTSLNASLTLGAPTGTPLEGQSLMFRIRDDGTARTLAYNGTYRAPTELPFPAATVPGKWTYLGFIYCGWDGRWDLVAAISNM